jgi:uncharacterized protein YqjF (DUF2071 family)
MSDSQATRPMFVADWHDALFVHFRVDAARLQPSVPLPLDRYNGDAYVSLVAFTQKRFRPARGGPVSRWLTAPLAQHAFLNVRTYVRHDQGCGVFFLTEWIPNRIAAMLAPRAYGLPYRLAHLHYAHDAYKRRHLRHVSSAGRQLVIEGVDDGAELATSRENSLDHFCCERYCAFTSRANDLCRFSVDHKPWPVRPVRATIVKSDLLATAGDWHRGAQVAAAHFSPGVADVAIGWPSVVGTANASASVAQ